MSNSESLTIEGSKLKPVKHLIAGIVFVAIGGYLIHTGSIFGWVCVLFFGLAIPASILQFFKRSYIKLDSSGFEVGYGAKPWRLDWHEVDLFYVGKIGGNKMIAIKYSSSYEKQQGSRKIASTLTGMEGVINNQFKLSPEQICKHLNDWKVRYCEDANT